MCNYVGPPSRTRLLLDAAPNRGVERKKKLARNLGPMWEGPRPSGITPARGAPQCMPGGSGSSQTRLGARLGARNPEIVSEFSTKNGGVEPLLAGVSWNGAVWQLTRPQRRECSLFVRGGVEKHRTGVSRRLR